MKKSILIVLAICAFSVNAISQKMATVNSSEIVMNMSETKAMQAQLKTKGEELGKQLETMYKQYESKAQELKGVNPNSMNAIQEAKMVEAQDLGKRIQKFEGSAQKEVQALEQKMTIPILEKAKKIIEEVSKSKGYTHVFDVSGGGLIVFPQGDDITNAVKQRLGIPINTNTTGN